MKIRLVRMGDLGLGDQICNVDDESLTTEEAINEAYDPDDQEWETLLERTSTQVLLTPDFGTPCTTTMYRRSYQSEQTIWLLVDDAGRPIKVDLTAVEWAGLSASRGAI